MRLVELDQIVASDEFLLEHLDVSLELLNFLILVFQITQQGFFKFVFIFQVLGLEN